MPHVCGPRINTATGARSACERHSRDVGEGQQQQQQCSRGKAATRLWHFMGRDQAEQPQPADAQHMDGRGAACVRQMRGMGMAWARHKWQRHGKGMAEVREGHGRGTAEARQGRSRGAAEVSSPHRSPCRIPCRDPHRSFLCHSPVVTPARWSTSDLGVLRSLSVSLLLSVLRGKRKWTVSWSRLHQRQINRACPTKPLQAEAWLQPESEWKAFPEVAVRVARVTQSPSEVVQATTGALSLVSPADSPNAGSCLHGGQVRAASSRRFAEFA